MEFRHYVVHKGDNLWDIAGRDQIFGDSFEWPLLFRENRDQIQDPDLIFPKQDLSYSNAISAQELKEIRKIAESTPPYHRHARRHLLPLG